MYSSNNFSKFDSVFYEWNTEINSALHLLIPICVSVMVFIVFIYRYSSQRISVRGFYFFFMLLPFGIVDAFLFFQKCWNLHELKRWWKKSCTNMSRDTFSHFNYFCIYMCVHEFMNLEVHSFHKRHHDFITAYCIIVQSINIFRDLAFFLHSLVHGSDSSKITNICYMYVFVCAYL